jgi:hypothetical protein
VQIAWLFFIDANLFRNHAFLSPQYADFSNQTEGFFFFSFFK